MNKRKKTFLVGFGLGLLVFLAGFAAQPWMPAIWNLGQVPDVTLSDPVNNGDAIIYNGTANVWTNTALPGGGDMLKATYDADLDGLVDAAAVAPAGADTQVQFNDGGALAGDSGLTYNKTTDILTITRNGPAFMAFENTAAAGDALASVGMLGHPEANLSFNMDYETGVHRFYDQSKNAMWLALGPSAWAIQYAPASAAAGDVWTGQGSPYLLWGDNASNIIVGTSAADTALADYTARMTLTRITAGTPQASLSGWTDLVIQGHRQRTGANGHIYLNPYQDGDVYLAGAGAVGQYVYIGTVADPSITFGADTGAAIFDGNVTMAYLQLPVGIAPSTPTASYGRIWWNTTNNHPYAINSAGTIFDLTTGGTGDFMADGSVPMTGLFQQLNNEATNGVVLLTGNGIQTFTTNADFTMSFSGAPSEGMWVSLIVTNSAATNIVMTFPSSFSLADQSNVTTDTITNGHSYWYQWYYDGAKYQVSAGKPVSAAGGGSGTMTTVQEGDAGVGDADIVTLDFATADFDLTESPDTEVNVVINAALTRDTEWNSLAKINAATTDDDAPGLAAVNTFSGASNIFSNPVYFSDDIEVSGNAAYNTLSVGTLTLTNPISGASIYLAFTPTNYTPTASGTNLQEHLEGIDAAIGAVTGDVTKVGTPVDNQVGVWTGDGTIEGDTALTFDTSTDSLYVGAIIELGHASDTTLARSGAGDITIEGNAIYRAGGTDVAIADGGTGAGTAAAAASALGVGTEDSPQFTGIELGHASANTLTASGGVLSIESNPLSSVSRVREIWIPAGAMNPSTTSPAAAATNTWATTTDDQTIEAWDFDADSDESVQFTLTLPTAWNGSDPKIKLHWKPVAEEDAYTNVWAVVGGSLNDNEVGGNTLGTPATVEDIGLTSTNTLHITSAITCDIGGTPSAGHFLWFKIYRDADAAEDGLEGDARLIGAHLQYVEATTEPSAW